MWHPPPHFFFYLMFLILQSNLALPPMRFLQQWIGHRTSNKVFISHGYQSPVQHVTLPPHCWAPFSLSHIFTALFCFGFFSCVLTLTHPLSALIPFLLFSPLLYPSSLPPHPLLSLLTWQITRSQKSFHFMYLLAQKSIWELSCSSPSLFLGVYSRGCLFVYLDIKGLPDNTNQIILYKQKDLLQLVIDVSYPLCSLDCYDCWSNPAKTT